MTDSSLELTKNVIVNYKDITSWILLGLILIFAYLNYRRVAALAEKIESFKAEFYNPLNGNLKHQIRDKFHEGKSIGLVLVC